MKGIILAGGTGTRLFPITRGVCKQLIPVFDKPLIYYPISVLMLADIKEILIISTKEDQNRFKALLGDGSSFGVNFEYIIQPEPRGLAEAFILGEKFIGEEDVCLVLGDNIFYGHGLRPKLKNAKSNLSGATIFGYQVDNPSAFGVIDLDSQGKVIAIEEKPKYPKSNIAATGLYFYTNEVIKIAKTVEPSERGELEITSINQHFLKRKKLEVETLGRGFTWFDTGTHNDLLDASNFIQITQKRQNLKIGCLEEIGYHNGWIKKSQLIQLGEEMKNEYGEYLIKICKD